MSQSQPSTGFSTDEEDAVNSNGEYMAFPTIEGECETHNGNERRTISEFDAEAFFKLVNEKV